MMMRHLLLLFVTLSLVCITTPTYTHALSIRTRGRGHEHQHVETQTHSHTDADAETHTETEIQLGTDVAVTGPATDLARVWLEKLLADIKKSGGSIGSIAQPTLFTKYTGSSQATILDLWSKPKTKRFTTCNGLTGIYLASVFGWGGLGRFDLDTYSKTKKYTYQVNQKGGIIRLPKYGDVCFYKPFHVFISLGWDKGVIESGQGGPKMGYDYLDTKDVTQNKKVVANIGWCLDVEAMWNALNPGQNGNVVTQTTPGYDPFWGY